MVIKSSFNSSNNISSSNHIEKKTKLGVKYPLSEAINAPQRSGILLISKLLNKKVGNLLKYDIVESWDFSIIILKRY